MAERVKAFFPFLFLSLTFLSVSFSIYRHVSERNYFHLYMRTIIQTINQQNDGKKEKGMGWGVEKEKCRKQININIERQEQMREEKGQRLFVQKKAEYKYLFRTLPTPESSESATVEGFANIFLFEKEYARRGRNREYLSSICFNLKQT